MNELQIFNHVEFGNICTLTIDGVPWFVGKDVGMLFPNILKQRIRGGRKSRPPQAFKK